MIKYEITEFRWVDFHFFSRFSFLWLRIVLLASYLLLSQQSEGIVCMFGSHFKIQDGCLSLIKLTNIILTVAAETLNPCSDMKLIPLIHIYFISGTRWRRFLHAG